MVYESTGAWEHAELSSMIHTGFYSASYLTFHVFLPTSFLSVPPSPQELAQALGFNLGTLLYILQASCEDEPTSAKRALQYYYQTESDRR